MGMPLSMLNHSQFKSFLLPEIILFSVLGIALMLVIVALLKKQESKHAKRFNFFSDMHWHGHTAFALPLYLSFGYS
jgi:hypothetical protein